MPRTNNYSAPALEKGLDIIELLARDDGGLTQNEIAQRLGRTVGEIFRMLEVLEARGYLRRSNRDGRYRLTLKLFELSHHHPPIRQLLHVALPEMRRLAETTGQSVHLSVHHDRRLLVIAQVDGFRSMGFSVRLGAHFPFRPDRVSARVLTAFQDAGRQRQLLSELCGGMSAAARRTLARRLAKIRRDGFVMEPSDTVTGVTDICHPIFDASGLAVAAMTLPYVRIRDNATTLDQSRRLAMATAATISARLGHRP